MICYFHVSVPIVFCFCFDVQKCHQDVVLFVVSVSFIFPLLKHCEPYQYAGISSLIAKKIFFLCIFICISFSKFIFTLYILKVYVIICLMYVVLFFLTLSFCTFALNCDSFLILFYFFASLYSMSKCFYLKKY